MPALNTRWWTLTSVPPLVLAAALCLWAVDVLNWDEWLIWADVLEKLRAGGFTAADLVLQNNEQRSLAERLIGLGLLPLFHLARWPELVLIACMALGSGLLAWRLLRATAPDARDPRLLAAMLALCLSLQQWEVFTVGLNTTMTLPVLALWAGLCLAWEAGRLSAGRFACLAALGLIPSFSFANALFYWPCLAPLVYLRGGPRGRALLLTGLWLGFGALVWAAYFHGLQRPPHHPSLLASLSRPATLAGYFLTYLGGALCVDRNLQPLALSAGLFALAALAFLARGALKGDTAAREAALPWLCAAAFSLLTALATAAARSGFGLGQALESRYAAFSTPLWVALIAMSAQAWPRLAQAQRRWLARGFAACGMLFVLGAVLAAVVLAHRKPRLEAARQELTRLTRPELLREIFPDPAFILARMPLFVDMGAGPWREARELTASPPGGEAAGGFEVTPAALLEGRVPGFLVRGEAPGLPDRPVLALAGGRAAGLGRSDARGGFEFFLPENALPKGRVELELRLPAARGGGMLVLPARPGPELLNPGRACRSFDLERNFFLPGFREGLGQPSGDASGTPADSRVEFRLRRGRPWGGSV